MPQDVATHSILAIVRRRHTPNAAGPHGRRPATPAGISRRTLLTVVPAVAVMAAAPAGPSHPDAELLALCAAYDALELQHSATFGNRLAGDPVEIEAERERLRIFDAQEPYVAAIFKSRALTMDGVRAKARTLLMWAPDLLDPPHDRESTLLLTLLRDLLTVRATPILPGVAGRASRPSSKWSRSRRF